MKYDKVWVILSYASHFFLPVVFPALVWLLVSSEYVKKHAKTVFFVDLVPTACNILFIIVVGLYGFSTGDEAGTTFIVLFMLIAMVVVNLIIFIWIIVRIVKVATNKM
ncbi:DUF4870 domain-containing protein [Listeria booriae]|uniref:DUF4870 domain-containing protein n=1 Tax=Listeria booriae TaxID=1552123 RepID=UPI00162A6AF2|nr:DUF4870 domain-containing protein [Listeria booriae]MBC1291813.1 DUF4870 domain-containing protein [Listeria booriae]MBC1513789.1 DUF4870 domain-containing protein [Listeria booriae]MBC1649128.1 DUF4870 domain-containing protein [Listeria booriae]MBC6152831.1 DUF4870 domain-containing protein [Listeria booriae]MBC6162253.1 DUF4870 domain-containing protein [Listeria booriae]